MATTQIMVVEDESIVALDLQTTLEELGYAVPVITTSGADALEKAAKFHLDLVLMDIMLKGEMDGIEAAEQLRVRFDIPVIYLTAYADNNTIQRAKLTEPSGYILKPFEERELQITLEMALYKHKVERKLKESEQWLTTVLQSIGDVVITTNTAGFITYLNPIAEKFTGWSQAEAVGKELKQVFKTIDGKTPTSIANSPRPTSSNLLLVARNGLVTPIEDSLASLKDSQGNINGVVLVFRDITPRKQAEEALRKSEEQLRQAQKMDAVGRLAGGVVHDFNNLLTSILDYSNKLSNKLSEGDPLRQEVEQLQKASQRASTLTQQLMAFSLKQTLQPKVLDLNTIVTEMDGILRRVMGDDIELTTTLGSRLGRVKVDPNQFQQVILNLALNARDAMSNGGKFTLETANIKLDEDSGIQHIRVVPGQYAMLTISDTGVGMDLETRSHLFEPFFTTKEPGRGTGLGLSTAYGIVRQSGGHIWVYSEPGLGTIFKIYLPITSDPDEPAVLKPTSSRLSRGCETVLVVEDEDGIRSLVRKLLQKSGYFVLEASHGIEALQVSEQYEDTIHLLLTDVVMPLMSGRELAERLALVRPNMKILYMSGYTREAIDHHGLLDPGLAFLQKPFTLSVLSQKIREVLEAEVPSS
ncbi:MAG: response regulator [Chloroflexota bacterium]